MPQRYQASPRSPSDPEIEQGHTIAARTEEKWENDKTTGRTSRDASYAVEALKDTVADRMRAQGEAAGKK